MAIELKVPEVGESITEVEIGGWLKSKGDQVEKDEPLVTLESEKATVELPAPSAGSLAQILKEKGEVAKVGEVIALLEANGHAEKRPAPVKSTEAAATKPETVEKSAQKSAEKHPKKSAEKTTTRDARVMPAAQRLIEERGFCAEDVSGSGPGGRVLKEDVLRHVEKTKPTPAERQQPRSQMLSSALPEASGPGQTDGREEEIIPMSRLRQTVAQRLVEAKQAAALLTTFNEIDMGAVMDLRKEYGEAFLKKYQVKLGFMSFFVKACIDALKQFPAINAEVRGANIVYRNYFDIGVAIGGGKGLVVPVLRNAERMSFAEVERAIGDFAQRARENKLTVDELRGGTFTISNGGIYGSLLSTPIVNPPQSGILGMHAIQDRPVARGGVVAIRPMMYLALTYDHRIVDGREAVTFLKRVKEAIEAPARMLIEV